jgi:methyl-accepting chemotaxis protein
MEESGRSVEAGQRSALEAAEKIKAALQGAAESAEVVDEISRGAEEQRAAMVRATTEINRIDAFTRENRALSGEVATDIDVITHQVTYLTDAVNLFRLPPAGESTHDVHRRMQGVAREAARRIGLLLERGVASGVLSLDDCFDQAYQPIAGTDPVKYHTRYDGYTDEHFPAVQEKVLAQFDWVVYAGAVDRNGYFPTHNRCFSEPLTGNRDYDLRHNRTKRVFEDRVGRTCGAHENDWKLQTYRRDTGELMFDMSAPIYVQGRHWGGFRVGYRID